ncbi:MAG: hypothetical protein AAGI07_13010 [Bacteroidota bacterium]
MDYLILCFFITYLLIGQDLVAQNSKSENIQYYHDGTYAYKIKQIDEFIDRFNNKIKYYNKGAFSGNVAHKHDRKNLIKGLFNKANKHWNFDELRDFINFVTNEYQPVFLNFYDPDWYAEVSCKVQYKGKPSDLKLMMKIQVAENGASKWVITGAKGEFLHLPEPEKKTSIKPSNHNLYFSSLSKALSDKKNLKNYVTSDYDGDKLTILFGALSTDKIQLEYIKAIKFHFLQIYGWIVEAEYIDNRTINAGWLINGLIKADNWEKRHYRKEILFLSEKNNSIY